MIVTTENYQIDTNLNLYTPSSSTLSVRIIDLALIKKGNEIIDCRLTLKADFKTYQFINDNSLLNLEPEANISNTICNFQESLPIQIEVSLRPDLLAHLQKYATNANEAAIYLFNECKTQKPDELTNIKGTKISSFYKSIDPLIATESWLALSVKQSQKSGEVGYCTLWYHASLLGISMINSSQEKISESIANLFQDLGMDGFGLSNITKKITAESLGSITDLLKELDKKTSEKHTQYTTSTPPIKKANITHQNFSSQPSIFQTIVNFFKEDDWHYVQLNGQSVLRLAFEGKNGKYDCYAQTREKQQQFIFYSICPIKVPKSKRRAVGEFISRANYGMIIGNFEINFNNGEIRYKTSTNGKKYFLEADTIRQLVYTNIKIIDEYFPGVIAVAKGRMSPEDAIAKIENQAN